MEIGPINGIRMIPAVKALRADSELAAVFDIAYSARAGDETYASSEKSAGGQDDGDGDSPSTATPEPATPSPDDPPPSSISFFA